MTKRVADYLTNALYEAGGEHVFLITGGMIMHLTDALLVHGKQKYVCCHHEQAAVMGAEAYGRYTGRPGVAYVTAGPGALNALTGVVGAWIDSAPLVVVSGQSKVSQATVTEPRQFALQGFNTLPIYSRVTKHAVMLTDLSTIRYEVEKAIWLTTHGRPGPVWIECPIDIQGTPYDPDDYEGLTPPAQEDQELLTGAGLQIAVADTLEALKKSKRPIILAGAGVRAANCASELKEIAERLNIPVLTSRLGMDLMAHEHPLFVGRPGTYGDRAANFAVQNADLMLVLGCRLSIGLVGYDYDDFGKRAAKIMVDADQAELDKPSVVPDVKILADAGAFLHTMLDDVRSGPEMTTKSDWPTTTRSWKEKYPVDEPEYAEETQGMNSYHFMRLFSERLADDAIVVLDTGSCFHVHAQAFRVKPGQRHIITGGLSTMGYCPAATGVAMAAAGKPVWCVTGDGSFQFNLQELQTVKHHNLNIRFMLLSNNGYLLIRHTQRNFQDGRYIGTHGDTGVSFPNLEAIAQGFGIGYVRVTCEAELPGALDRLEKWQGPVICEVMTPPNQLLQPRVASKQLEDGTMVSMPYDHMFPFLPEEEYRANQFDDDD